MGRHHAFSTVDILGSVLSRLTVLLELSPGLAGHVNFSGTRVADLRCRHEEEAMVIMELLGKHLLE